MSSSARRRSLALPCSATTRIFALPSRLKMASKRTSLVAMVALSPDGAATVVTMGCSPSTKTETVIGPAASARLDKRTTMGSRSPRATARLTCTSSMMSSGSTLSLPVARTDKAISRPRQALGKASPLPVVTRPSLTTIKPSGRTSATKRAKSSPMALLVPFALSVVVRKVSPSMPPGVPPIPRYSTAMGCVSGRL